MKEIRQMVQLPDGKKVLEVETIVTGGSETQAVFSYYDPITLEKMDKKGYETDYWGKIENLKILEGNE